MTDKIRVYATLDLPFAVGLDGTVLGAVERTVIGGLPYRVVLPTILWTGDRAQVERPSRRTLPSGIDPPPSNTASAWQWGIVSNWNPTERTVLGWWVTRIVLRRDGIEPPEFSQAPDGRYRAESPALQSLVEASNAWVARLAEWIEAVADQDTERESPLQRAVEEGAGLTIWVRRGTTHYRPPRHRRLDLQIQQFQLLNRHGWRRVLQEAGGGTSVGEERRLLAQASAAYRRGNTRRSAIDIGTAVEIVLSRLLEERTGKRRNWALGRLVAQLGTAVPVPKNDLDYLVKLRNKSVHENRSPTPTDTIACIKTARELIDSVTPL